MPASLRNLAPRRLTAALADNQQPWLRTPDAHRPEHAGGTPRAPATLRGARRPSRGLHARRFDSLTALVVAGVLLASALYGLAAERWWSRALWQKPASDPWRQMLALGPAARALLPAAA
jgi:hypothetical protein